MLGHQTALVELQNKLKERMAQHEASNAARRKAEAEVVKLKAHIAELEKQLKYGGGTWLKSLGSSDPV
jgi:hypothetical protein